MDLINDLMSKEANSSPIRSIIYLCGSVVASSLGDYHNGYRTMGVLDEIPCMGALHRSH